MHSLKKKKLHPLKTQSHWVFIVSFELISVSLFWGMVRIYQLFPWLFLVTSQVINELQLTRQFSDVNLLRFFKQHLMTFGKYTENSESI